MPIKIGSYAKNATAMVIGTVFGAKSGDVVRKAYDLTWGQWQIGKDAKSNSSTTTPDTSYMSIVADGKKPKMTDNPLTDSNRNSFDPTTYPSTLAVDSTGTKSVDHAIIAKVAPYVPDAVSDAMISYPLVVDAIGVAICVGLYKLWQKYKK